MEVRLLKQLTQANNTPVKLYGYDTSASAWYAISCDPSGHLSVKHAIEFEMTGSPLNVRNYDASATTTLITATATQQLKIYKIFLSCETTIGGAVSVSLGSKNMGKVRNPIPGGNHPLISANPDYEIGSSGASLVVSVPSGNNITLTVHYE